MKRKADVNDVKSKVQSLLGKKVVVRLNKGRNKVKNYKGVLQEAHSNVFVVELSGEVFDRISCSYTDMICGEVHIFEQPSA